MPKSKKKKTRRTAGKSAVDALDQLRPGMPAKDNIIKVVDFVPRKDSQKVHYKILKTTEMDAYDRVPPQPKKNSGRKS